MKMVFVIVGEALPSPEEAQEWLDLQPGERKEAYTNMRAELAQNVKDELDCDEVLHASAWFEDCPECADEGREGGCPVCLKEVGELAQLRKTIPGGEELNKDG